MKEKVKTNTVAMKTNTVAMKMNTVAMNINTRDSEGDLFAVQWSTSV